MSLIVGAVPGVEIMVAVGLFTTLTSLVLRLVARSKQKSPFGMDDYLAILAWVTYLGVNIATIYALVQRAFAEEIVASVNGDLTNGSPAMFTFYVYQVSLDKGLFGGSLCNIAALGCGRLSAIFFFRRIFYTAKHDMFDVITKIMLGILLLWTVGFFFLSLFACGVRLDIAAAGFALYQMGSGALSSASGSGSPSEPMDPNYTTNCVSESNANALSISSFLLDFLVLLLPLPKIWALQTSYARKIAISGVFLVALISLTASGLRLAMVYQMEITGYYESLFVISNSAASVVNPLSYFYQLLETAACLTAINMPSVWYLFRYSKVEKPRQTVALVSDSLSTKLGETGRSNVRLLKNESMISNDEGIPTRRAHLELEPSGAFIQDDTEKSIYQV